MSSKLDLVVRNGQVVTPARVLRADLGVQDGRFVAIGECRAPAAEEIDARGLYVFPGILDAHVHFNEPGRAEWEGLSTGSAALAAGGGTWFCDMPLNSTPPVVDRASLELKKACAQEKSHLDFSLWGGFVPGNVARFAELRDGGVAGLKVFLCDTGIADFQAVTDHRRLREGMIEAAKLDLLVAVHAEDDALAARLTAEARRNGARDARGWLATRPLEVELRAIRLLLELAGETGCRLHIVHVSSPDGAALIAAARRAGVDVTAETCPHYLLLDEADVLRLGAAAKCAPPLRDAAAVAGLWEALGRDVIDTIGSDHSPAPPEMKRSQDFFEIWGGISGCQHGFKLLLSEALARGATADVLPRFARLLAANVAARLRIDGRKGAIAEGRDADFVLLDLAHEHVLENGELLYRHRQGPYAGRRCGVGIVRTVVRGRTVWREGRLAAAAGFGQFLPPEPRPIPRTLSSVP